MNNSWTFSTPSKEVDDANENNENETIQEIDEVENLVAAVELVQNEPQLDEETRWRWDGRIK